MPKALSLKKNINKNQKAITQFFKNKPHVENIVSPDMQQSELSTELKPSKRKVLSPTTCTLNEIQKAPDDLEMGHISKRCKLVENVGSCNGTNTITNGEKKHEMSSQTHFKSPVKNGINDHIKLTSKATKETELDKTSNEIHNRKPNLCLTNNEEKCNDKINNKLNLKNKENHVSFEDNTGGNKLNMENNLRKSMSPKKCSAAITSRSPIKNEVHTHSESEENHVHELDFDKDVFGEEFDIDDIDENEVENLDLTSIQRCEVLSVKKHPNRLQLKLKNCLNERGTCFVEGIWLNTPLQVGEVLSVLASRDTSGFFMVGNSSGLLVLRPDHLISSTSVVAGVFCKRKAVLQERWRGIDSANTAMTIGTLIHELVQKALTQSIASLTDLQKEAESIVKDSIQLLYDAGLTEQEAISNIQMYLPPLAEFMQKYVVGSSKTQQNPKDNWNGKIDKVLDIEENVCCHQLGLKGKIDATLQVTIHNKKGGRQEIVPLELKSGRASASAEHRGQLVLYGMMLALQRGRQPHTDAHMGLLLYLKERVDLKEVGCGYPERRDLIMLRNDLAQHLAPAPEHIDTVILNDCHHAYSQASTTGLHVKLFRTCIMEQIGDIEDTPQHINQSLPEPVHNDRACSKCPYLTICSLHLWHTDKTKVSEAHPLSKLKDQALGHLTPKHIQYFLQWTSLFLIEEKAQRSSNPLHALWTDTVEKRSRKGVCAANLKLKSVTEAEGRYLHVFLREQVASDATHGQSKLTRGPQEGEFSIVSIDKRPWIAAGVITMANESEIQILLERDLSGRLDKSTLFHIDMYESYSTTVQNLTNLGVLMEDSERALRLRKIIIDKEEATFVEKLPREVGRLGVRLLRRLNSQQQRAVLRAAAAQRYVLLGGLPGTGKTQTISVLIQLLAALRLRVLVTAHAHAAVDNVLERLPASLRVMRLGPVSRVSVAMRPRSEHALAALCETPEQLQNLYDSMEVVGVTCLGAAHAMLARTSFDVCIVDEATQVLQSTVVRALCAAARFVLVGDPHQLPPVVRSAAARRLGMEESLFHRLTSPHNTCTLQLQYRMNQPLAQLANAVAYSDQLQCADQTVALATMNLDIKKLPHFSEEEEWLKIACSLEPKDAAVFFDLALSNDQKCTVKTLTNPYEACVVMALTETLIMGGIDTSDIGVIAPYREQVSLLRRCLARCNAHARGAPEVSTVDQFQGRDKSVIIYSGTKRADDIDKKVREGEVLNDQRRLAVSVTRAKHKLLLVGSGRALKRYAPLARFIRACDTATLHQHTIDFVYAKYGHFIT